MTPIKTLAAILACTCSLSGCTTYKQASSKIDKTHTQIETLDKHLQQAEPTVITKTGYYINPEPHLIEHLPAWLQTSVNLHAQNLPLTILLTHLTRGQPVSLNFDPAVNLHELITLDYKGTLKGALDLIANSTNTLYSAQGNKLQWEALETRVFDISFMPGTSNYLVGQNQGEKNSSHYGTSNSSNQLNDQQFSNLQAQLSLWNDLRHTLNQLKSKKGKLVISESTTTVTVTDQPNKIREIAHYLEQINRRLNQQVAIKVQILEITLKNDFNYGIDWNLITQGLGTKFRIFGNAGSATNLVNDNLMANSSNAALSQIGIGSNGMDVFINALSQQGKVRVVTQPEVVTLNNQIASIRITQSTGYIESVSQTTSQFFSTSSINPGSITDGFTLYVLPKIQAHKIYLQLSSTIANLERLEKVSNVPSGKSTTTSNYQAIQVPTVAEKSFNQRSLIGDGKTLVLAGYRQQHDAVSKSSFFGVDPLGGKGASSKSVETLVLITPTILHSDRRYDSTHS